MCTFYTQYTGNFLNKARENSGKIQGILFLKSCGYPDYNIISDESVVLLYMLTAVSL